VSHERVPSPAAKAIAACYKGIDSLALGGVGHQAGSRAQGWAERAAAVAARSDEHIGVAPGTGHLARVGGRPHVGAVAVAGEPERCGNRGAVAAARDEQHARAALQGGKGPVLRSRPRDLVGGARQPSAEQPGEALHHSARKRAGHGGYKSRIVTFVVLSVHLLAGAAWLGAMAYSLAVVQPRAARYFADRTRERERFAVELAAGARRPVLVAVALLAASGAALVLLERGARETGWWTLVGLKAVGVGAALAVFVHVSWRLWPARLFATNGDLDSHRRRFGRAAGALTAIVAIEFVLGVAATTLR
jgi:hypothetical protein